MLADETSKIRLVGFDVAQQKKLQDFQLKKMLVELVNCEVKEFRFGEGYQLMLKSGSGIKESSKIMDVSTSIVENELSSKQITLDQLPGMELFTDVTVTVKAIELMMLFSSQRR